MLVAAALGGLGIVQLPSFVGDAQPELASVLPELEQPYSVWLVVPQARRRLPAVRAVCEAIRETFGRERSGANRHPASVRAGSIAAAARLGK